MIKRIISGGQTGADQAALDAAIEMNIPHGGWVPKGRKTERGRLPDKYNVQETNAIDYAQRTEFNILDSDGTLIFSHGTLKGGSALTRKLANKHYRSCIHIDLNEIQEYKAIEIIQAWIDVKGVEILNVAGPRASEDPQIYEAVKNILMSLFYPPPESITLKLPSALQDAVNIIEEALSLKDKIKIAKIEKNELHTVYPLLSEYLDRIYRLNSTRDGLWESGRYLLKKDNINKYDISNLIIEELWKKLRKSHRLKVVK